MSPQIPGFSYSPRPLWLMRLRFTRYLIDDFETGSFFYDWTERITSGHRKDEDQLQSRYTESQGSVGHEEEEQIAEDYAAIERLTSSLYATLVVGIWGRLELFLKILAECSHAAQVAAGSAKKQRMYKFHEIKNVINKNTSVNIEQIPHFDVINAMRILNNCYKHNDGVYDLSQNNPHESIDNALLTAWNAIDGEGRIDFSKLPYSDIVNKCFAFCAEVHAKVEQALNKQTTKP
jgi:hypothetical protein